MKNFPRLSSEFASITKLLSTLDLSDVESTTKRLDLEWPEPRRAELGALLREAHATGSLTPRKAGPTVEFGRLSKPSPDTHDHSVDAVYMAGPGAPHTHPRGEVSLCFAESGSPRFCGHPEGWVVLPPGSHHTPEVTGGFMLIVYFLPGGAMEWGSANKAST